MMFSSINPATDMVVAEYPVVDQAEALKLLGQINNGFNDWRKTSLKSGRPVSIVWLRI